MIAECLVIFGISAAMLVIFLRTNREHAILTVPLMILPAVNILAYLSSEVIASVLPIDHFTMYVLLNTLAVILSSVACGIFSARLKTRHTRIAYLSMCILFNVVLASILIHNMAVAIFG